MTYMDVAVVDEIEEEAKTRVYPAIVNYLVEHQRPPAIAWLMEELGYSSTSVTRSRMTKLVEIGWLERKDGAITVPGARVVLGNDVRERLDYA